MGSPSLIPKVQKDDWVNLNRVLRKLAFAALGSGSAPSFGGLSLTGPLNMNDNHIYDIGYLDFSLINGIPAAEARLIWDDDAGTLHLGLKGGTVNLSIGAEEVIRATNDSGGDLLNGTPAYISGSTGGASANVTFRAGDADFATGVGLRTVGLITEDIDDNQKGYITTTGLVHDVDTSMFSAAGQPVYLAKGGGYALAPPTSPDITVILGVVVRKHATEGIILVLPTSLPNLNHLSDVLIASLANNDLLVWNSAANVYKNTRAIIGLLNVEAGLAKFGTVDDNSEFESDGTLKFAGAAKVWNDIQFSISTARVPAANAPTWSDFGANTKKFTFAVNDLVDLEANEVSHSYFEGSDLHCHVHLYNNGVDITDRTVKYQLDLGITNPDEVYSESTVSAQFTIPADTPDKSHFNLDIVELDGTGLKSGAEITIRLTRIVEDSGTAPSNDPFVSMVGIHIEEDTIGSRTENLK